jgi:hypothetical protein
MIALYPVLRQRIKQTEISWCELAAATGINSFAFHLKMWGIKRWNLTEVVRICGFFNTPDAEHLFVRNYNKQQFLESQEENGNGL